jgi:Leucine-rich repeat (LRR) protein
MKILLRIVVFNLVLSTILAENIVIGNVNGNECIFEFQKVERDDDVRILINYSNNTNEIVTIVEFSDSKIYKVLPEFFEIFDDLRELYLENNDVEVIEANTFQEAINLRILDLSHNQLELISENAFLGSKLLRHLELSHNQIQTRVFISSTIN